MVLLEKEWGRYKYTVLERSPAIYQAIRTLLKDKEVYPVQDFYHLIEDALNKETQPGSVENAAQHVWGYFKNKATPQERKAFEKNMGNFRNGTGSLSTVKRQLFRLATKYEEQYLLQSLYFYLN